MHDLSERIKQNAVSAHRASEQALSTSGMASKGGQVVDTMLGVNEPSRGIADIIQVPPTAPVESSTFASLDGFATVVMDSA